ncbi:MAG: 30S ribosomal protein S16 [Thermoleophilaceae bacterium]|nr:30S ribosomal protein S16 [Thermoleophilaceae bacterium]
MSVRVRLTRVGSRKNPIWRVVVTDQRSPRDGRFIETIGHYNPQTEPSTIAIDEERLEHWLARGAQPTGTVKQLIKAQAKAGAVVAEGPAQPAAAPEPGAAEPEAAEPEREPAAAEPAEAEREPGAEAEPEAGEAEPAAPLPADAGEGEPPSAPPGEPAPGVEQVEADPEAAPAERASR